VHTARRLGRNRGRHIYAGNPGGTWPICQPRARGESADWADLADDRPLARGSRRSASAQRSGLRFLRKAADNSIICDVARPDVSTLKRTNRACVADQNVVGQEKRPLTRSFVLCSVEARRIELPNLLHAMQALYQLSYAPAGWDQRSKSDLRGPTPSRSGGVVPPARRARAGVLAAQVVTGQPGGDTSSWIDALGTGTVLENVAAPSRCRRRTTLLPS
jgi:hypothetical protein